MTVREARALGLWGKRPGRGARIRARRTEAIGRMWDSGAEAQWVTEDVEVRRLAGEIYDVEYKPRYVFTVTGPFGSFKLWYTADARWRERSDGRLVVADCKGAVTERFRLQRRLMRAFYGITILEVRAPRARRARRPRAR